ncbi:MAG: hypothetical protein NTY66_02755 [Candidatus Vogelbacteria bacterium]|nr:hypothetical protein [Candidatus Vogelbacteria bacterium]
MFSKFLEVVGTIIYIILAIPTCLILGLFLFAGMTPFINFGLLLNLINEPTHEEKLLAGSAVIIFLIGLPVEYIWGPGATLCVILTSLGIWTFASWGSFCNRTSR